jgi:hypothetical protein
MKRSEWWEESDPAKRYEAWCKELAETTMEIHEGVEAHLPTSAMDDVLHRLRQLTIIHQPPEMPQNEVTKETD